MRVSGISWAGVATANLEQTIRFFAETLRLPLVYRDDDEGVTVFRLPAGDSFEVFAPNSRWHQYRACPVFGFEVDDVRAARKEMEDGGVEFVTDITEMEDGAAWTYFRGPDGVLYELQRPAG